MQKKPPKLRPDAAEIAFRVMHEAIGEAAKTLPPNERSKKNPDAIKRGARGGKVSAKRREKLSHEERARAATIAALARWKKMN
jgi:hypothetical protein